MDRSAPLFTPVLIVGCFIMLLSFAVRASFGVFQLPIADEFGWARTEFSLAIAIQNLAWGIGQPIFGALAEKIGDRRAIVIGGITYAVGLVLSSYSIDYVKVILKKSEQSGATTPSLPPWREQRRMSSKHG